MKTKREINRKDLRAFPRPVADLVLQLVNTRGVRARMLDGRHVFLYAPNGDTRKVSSARKANESVAILQKWEGEL